MKYLFIIISIVFMGCPRSYAQSEIPAGDIHEYYYRLLQISGKTDDPVSYHLRPVVTEKPISGQHPWSHLISSYHGSPSSTISLYEPVWFQSYNTTLPRGTNDGALWQGRGYNGAFTAGFASTLGPLHLYLRPTFGFSQNRHFNLAPYDPPLIIREPGIQQIADEFAYRDFRGIIDYVQRYGDDTYAWFDWGESSIELRYKGLRTGFSNKQIWTGPAMNTSLQYGYSAPGFLHYSLGTYRPLETAAGSFEFAYIFGGLRRSDYFDDHPAYNLQSINSLLFIYQPWFTDHFSVGVLRSFLQSYPTSFSEYKDQLLKLINIGFGTAFFSPNNEAYDNQTAEVFLRYYLPDYGFEFYFEYGRNDHNANLRDFWAQPDHFRAYTVGLIKTFELSDNRLLALRMEMNQLEVTRTTLTRGSSGINWWYSHATIRQGFANDGQIPGSGWGPGNNAQMIHADLFKEDGKIGLKMGRIVYNNSLVDQQLDQIRDENDGAVDAWEVRNIEFLVGADMTFFLPYDLELFAAIDQSYIMNHHYLKGNDKLNTRFELTIRKRMNGWLR